MFPPELVPAAPPETVPEEFWHTHLSPSPTGVCPCCSELHIRNFSCIKQCMHADILYATRVHHTRYFPCIKQRIYADIPYVTYVYQLFCRTDKLQ